MSPSVASHTASFGLDDSLPSNSRTSGSVSTSGGSSMGSTGGPSDSLASVCGAALASETCFGPPAGPTASTG